MRSLIVLSLACVVASCTATVSAMDPRPKFRSPDETERLAVPVAVYLDPQIRDAFVTESTGVSGVEVSGFRTTLANGFRNSYAARLFQSMTFVDTKTAPVMLTLDVADPKPIKVSSPGDGGMADVKFQVEFQASLVHDGKRIGDLRMTVISDESAQLKTDIDRVFLNCMEKMFVALNDGLLTSENVSILRDGGSLPNAPNPYPAVETPAPAN